MLHATPHEPTAARESFGDIAPALAAYTDQVLFGDVWERPGLSKLDRSRITHPAFSAGWPTANSAVTIARQAFTHGATHAAT